MRRNVIMLVVVIVGVLAGLWIYHHVSVNGRPIGLTASTGKLTVTLTATAASQHVEANVVPMTGQINWTLYANGRRAYCAKRGPLTDDGTNPPSVSATCTLHMNAGALAARSHYSGDGNYLAASGSWKGTVTTSTSERLVMT